MDLWQPSHETLRVLSQMGYTDSDLQSSVLEFGKILDKGDLFLPTDKDFVLFIRCYKSNKSESIERKLLSFEEWKPTQKEVDQLLKEGYWELLIFEQLIYFKSRYRSTKIIQSHFGLFRNFLRRQNQLTKCSVDSWTPPSWLLRIIKNDFSFDDQCLRELTPEFKKSCVKKNVPPTNICRFFYNYTKKHSAIRSTHLISPI